MATEKQIKYIKKLSDWKKATVPNNVEQLTEEQASALIDELKQLKSVKPTQKELVTDPAVPSLTISTWNPIQAGMVKKAVAERFEYDEHFAARCLELYKRFEEADALIKQHYPEVQK